MDGKTIALIVIGGVIVAAGIAVLCIFLFA